MPIEVIAMGRVTEGPTCVDREDAGTAVFVLAPFPELAGAAEAHACEVVCRGYELAMPVMEGVRPGDRLAVVGDLMMQRMQGPLEDDPDRCEGLDSGDSRSPRRSELSSGHPWLV